ncbi:hypothetical protein ACFL1I_06650 [Candidatus Omnitrophota bacterium]
MMKMIIPLIISAYGIVFLAYGIIGRSWIALVAGISTLTFSKAGRTIGTVAVIWLIGSSLIIPIYLTGSDKPKEGYIKRYDYVTGHEKMIEYRDMPTETSKRDKAISEWGKRNLVINTVIGLSYLFVFYLTPVSKEFV